MGRKPRNGAGWKPVFWGWLEVVDDGVDAVAHYALRGFDFDFFADATAEEDASDGRFDADLFLGGVGFAWADELVGDLDVPVEEGDGDAGTDGGDVGVEVGPIGDDGAAEGFFELAAAVFGEGEGFASGVVGGVLAEVAVGTCCLDGANEFGDAAFEVGELALEGFDAVGGHFKGDFDDAGGLSGGAWSVGFWEAEAGAEVFFGVAACFQELEPSFEGEEAALSVGVGGAEVALAVLFDGGGGEVGGGLVWADVGAEFFGVGGEVVVALFEGGGELAKCVVEGDVGGRCARGRLGHALTVALWRDLCRLPWRRCRDGIGSGRCSGCRRGCATGWRGTGSW